MESTLVRVKELSASAKSLMVIASILAIASLYYGRAVFIPLALALVLSFLLTPFVSLLEKIRLGRVPSVIVVITISFLLIGAVTWGVAGQLAQIISQIPDYKENLDAKMRRLHRPNSNSFTKATASVQELNKELSAVPGQVAGQVQARNQGITHSAKPIPVEMAPPATNLFQDLGALLGPLSGPLKTAAIVIIFTIFMMVEREDLRNRAIRLAGRGRLSLMTQALDDAARRLSRFLLLQFLVNTGYGALFGLGLYLVGVPHAFLWGLVATLLRFVPYIGSFIAAALPIAMAIAVFPGWRQAAIAFGVFLVLELTISNFVEPLLYGSHTGISTLAILVAAMFWATLWGPIGLILSTPLTVCLVVLGRHVPQLKFLEVVLGDEPALPPEQHFYQRLLAADPDEARSIADTYVKENSLESLYQSIIIPALRLAEQDYEIDALDEDSRRFLLRSTGSLIEDLGAEFEDRPLPAVTNDKNNGQCRHAAVPPVGITCIPFKSGSDELVAMMFVQLLERTGYHSQLLKGRAAKNALEGVLPQDYGIVCVSSLSPAALARLRTFCRRLQANNPTLRIILGLWGLEGGGGRAHELLGASCSGTVVTTLSAMLEEVRQVSGSAVEAAAGNRSS